MRILFTNNTLDFPCGTERAILEVAPELVARGHQVEVFTLEPGQAAAVLTAANLPVHHDLDQLPFPPDVIHGHHAIETTLAAATFRKTPVISFCHGPEAWQEAPCRMPNVVRWVAVDETCRRRLIEDEKVAADRIDVVLTCVALERFPQRSPLPPKPTRALVLSNSLRPEHDMVDAIREACSARDIDLDIRGFGFRNPVEDPGSLLGEYDLVFGKARVALEALAVGCAVVQADYFGAGSLITTENFPALRRLNLGYKSMTAPASAEHLLRQIDLYDPADAALLSDQVRATAGLPSMIDALEDLYQRACETPCADYDPIRVAPDFWRFHLYLSKLPLQSLQKTRGVPLRLPTPPLQDPPAVAWKALCDKHTSYSALEIAAAQAQTKEADARTHEAYARLDEFALEITRLHERLTFRGTWVRRLCRWLGIHKKP